MMPFATFSFSVLPAPLLPPRGPTTGGRSTAVEGHVHAPTGRLAQPRRRLRKRPSRCKRTHGTAAGRRQPPRRAAGGMLQRPPARVPRSSRGGRAAQQGRSHRRADALVGRIDATELAGRKLRLQRRRRGGKLRHMDGLLGAGPGRAWRLAQRRRRGPLQGAQLGHASTSRGGRGGRRVRLDHAQPAACEQEQGGRAPGDEGGEGTYLWLRGPAGQLRWLE